MYPKGHQHLEGHLYPKRKGLEFYLSLLDQDLAREPGQEQEHQHPEVHLYQKRTLRYSGRLYHRAQGQDCLGPHQDLHHRVQEHQHPEVRLYQKRTLRYYAHLCHRVQDQDCLCLCHHQELVCLRQLSFSIS